jgi:hypothetical protein
MTAALMLFENAGKVGGVCADQGVPLSGTAPMQRVRDIGGLRESVGAAPAGPFYDRPCPAKGRHGTRAGAAATRRSGPG